MIRSTSWLALLLVCSIITSVATACGYGPTDIEPSHHFQASAQGSLKSVGQMLHRAQKKQALLRLRQLDQMTTATIFCQLEDGTQLDVLDAERTEAKDENVTQISLDLLSSDRVDAMLEQAIKLPNLQSITINFCWGGAGTLTETQVRQVARCKQLRELNLVKTSLTAEQLAPLKDSPRLTKIVLDQKCHVPVETLAELKSLREIRSDQPFSDEQQKTLAKHLPNCKLVFPKPK